MIIRFLRAQIIIIKTASGKVFCEIMIKSVTKFLRDTNFVSYNYKLNYSTIIIIITLIIVVIIIIVYYVVYVVYVAHEFRKPNPTRNFQLCSPASRIDFNVDPTLLLYSQNDIGMHYSYSA